jgi:hypothetical protein
MVLAKVPEVQLRSLPVQIIGIWAHALQSSEHHGAATSFMPITLKHPQVERVIHVAQHPYN